MLQKRGPPTSPKKLEDPSRFFRISRIFDFLTNLRNFSEQIFLMIQSKNDQFLNTLFESHSGDLRFRESQILRSSRDLIKGFFFQKKELRLKIRPQTLLLRCQIWDPVTQRRILWFRTLRQQFFFKKCDFLTNLRNFSEQIFWRNRTIRIFSDFADFLKKSEDLFFEAFPHATLPFLSHFVSHGFDMS